MLFDNYLDPSAYNNRSKRLAQMLAAGRGGGGVPAGGGGPIAKFMARYAFPQLSNPYAGNLNPAVQAGLGPGGYGHPDAQESSPVFGGTPTAHAPNPPPPVVGTPGTPGTPGPPPGTPGTEGQGIPSTTDNLWRDSQGLVMLGNGHYFDPSSGNFGLLPGAQEGVGSGVVGLGHGRV